MEIAAGGELYDFLSERKCLEENEARRIFRQIATAVYYCHKHNICHRDLKLENILLDENGCAKVRYNVLIHQTQLKFDLKTKRYKKCFRVPIKLCFLIDCRFWIVKRI